MTRFQKFLVFLIVAGVCALGSFHLTKPVDTPDDYLKTFHLSVQRVLRHMRFAETSTAKKETQKALSSIRSGIKLFPDRLDLRLSEIHFCQMIGQTDCMTNAMAATLEQAQKNKHNWLWSGTEKKGKSFMLSAFQTYQKNLWLAKEDAAFQKNAELILSFYPNNVTNLDNLGVLYLEKKAYDKAKDYLERAHLLDPSDQEVIAHLQSIPDMEKKAEKKALPTLQKSGQKSTSHAAKKMMPVRPKQQKKGSKK